LISQYSNAHQTRLLSFLLEIHRRRHQQQLFLKKMTDLPGNAAIRNFMDKLTSSTNVSRYIELPMICVMGDTSSGKSLLLSSICMTELPSSHQLTTRCPILLKMHQSSADGIRAVISVQWKSNTSPEQQQYEHFEPRIITVDDWETLPQVILEAQTHILSQTKKEVARDVVSVAVYRPDCLDLTLMDLPGMVRSRGADESETLVEDVEQLIEEYLRNQRCVILAVVPANVDFHNSQILADAEAVDKDTKRTIPVITKPDLIDAGAEDDVLELLMGKKVKFALGFHMTKGRGQLALEQKQTIEDGLQHEADFFDTVSPWKDVQDREMFGTANLRQKLGDLQMSMIRETVPGILKEIRLKQQHAFDALVEMGNLHQSAADKRRYYQDFCQVFLNNLKATLSGKGRTGKRVGEASAAARLHECCNRFMSEVGDGSLGTIRSIVEGALVLVTSAKGDVRGEVVHIDKSKGIACVDFVNEKDRTTEVLFDYVGYKSEELLEKDDVWSDGSKVFIARDTSTFDLLKNIPLDRLRSDPSWLKQKMAENRTDDLACFLNIDIFKSIVSDFIDEDWKPHCTQLVDETEDIIMAAISESLDRTATSDRYPKLRALIKQQSKRTAQALILEARKQVTSHLEIEKHPYTQDHVLFENISSARHRGLKREIEVALRLDQEGGVYDTAAIKSIVDGVFERSRQKSVEEHMAEDMEIVLESYGKVATKRVIDRTPMICWEVFRSLATSVQDTLWNSTDDVLKENMQDSPEFAQKYKEVTEELEEMNKALSIVQSLAYEES
jgi:GTPase SAR1 family protein